MKRRRIAGPFRTLRSNDDANNTARRLLDGEHL